MTTWQLDDRPARRPEIESVDVEGELVLWDPRGQRVHRLDPVASLLWPFLDGTTTIDELAGDAADVWETSHDDARRGITNLVAQLDQADLLHDGEPLAVTETPDDDVPTITNPVRCGTDLSPWAWQPTTTVEVGGRTIAFRASHPEVAAGLRAALRAHVVPVDAPVNYSLALGAERGDLHILFWGHCTVARCRTVPEAVGALLSHLHGHGPTPDGAVRLDGHLLVAQDKGVYFPANERGALWGIAAQLRKEGAQLVHRPWVDVDAQRAVAVHVDAPLELDHTALVSVLGDEPNVVAPGGEPAVVGMYVPEWMDASSPAALATSFVQQRLLIDPPGAIARFAQLAPHLRILHHAREARGPLAAAVRSALGLTQQ